MLFARLLTSIPLLVAFLPSSYAQSIAEEVTVAPGSQLKTIGLPLEKLVGYFTSGAVPSVVVGFGGSPGGLYLYTSTSDSIKGPWGQTAISRPGSAYEDAVAFTNRGDRYPGIIASIQPAGSSKHQTILYKNPKNSGGDPTNSQWETQVINPKSGCHAMRLADIDGDGKLDVVCSASKVLGTDSFIAFQNKDNDWQVVNKVAPLGDGVDVISIGGGGVPQLAGANTADGNIYWYRNPCARVPFLQTAPCSVSRKSLWKSHRINSDNAGIARGNAFTSAPVTPGGVAGLITAANEVEDEAVYTPGLAWFYPSALPDRPWTMVVLDNTYRDVHKISTGIWHGGVPYIIIAEEEQACPPARPDGHPPDHQTPCRIAMFQYIDGVWRQTVLSQASTHNQSVIPWGNGLLMADANHGFFGADRSIHIRVIQP
jgi:hypothetical protein